MIHLRLQLVYSHEEDWDFLPIMPDPMRVIYISGSPPKDGFLPTWQDFTDYNGKLVPLDIIARMKEMEGSSEKEWNRRGVVVGDKSWEILLDWYTGLS